MDSLAFSPDGRLVAAAGLGGDTIRFWDAVGGLERRTIKPPVEARSLAFSPDGSILAAGCKTSVVLWEVATGKELATLTGHTSDVRAVAFSPDGAQLVSGANDGLRLWGVK